MKTCTKCKIEKSLEAYSECKHTKDKLQSWCKECNLIQGRKYYKDNKEKVDIKNRNWDKDHRRTRNSYRLQYRYGITIEEYERMYAIRDGKCDICQEIFEKLHIDHCHESGKLRGLLCKACNVSLGNFKDNIEVMNRAIDYLKRNKAQ